MNKKPIENNKIDKKFEFFKTNIYSLRERGDLIATYNVYLEALRDIDPITDKKITPTFIKTKFREYLQYKQNQKSEFVKGKTLTKNLKEYLFERLHLQSYKNIKIRIPERDSYLFGKKFLS